MAVNGGQSRFQQSGSNRLRVSQFQDFDIANCIQIQSGIVNFSPQNLVQYTVPENVMLLVTYISVKAFDYSTTTDISFPQGAIVSDNDMAGHLDTNIWLTANGIAYAVSNPTSNYLALSNRPVIFLFGPLTTLNLIFQFPSTALLTGQPWHLGVTPPMGVAGGLHGWLIQGNSGQIFQTLQTSVGSIVGYPGGTSGSSSSAAATVPTNTPF
jgi:hypothetical protein